MEDWQKIAVLIFTFAPVLFEAWRDRNGQKRKGKIWDTVAVVAYTVALTWGAYLLRINWVAVPIFILIFRICTFDYFVNYFLKKHHRGHEDINIWKFTGTTTWFWDQWVAKVDWRIRLLARLVVLIASMIYMFRN